MAIDSDVLVVGGGLAGVTAALSAAREGAGVRLVSHKESTLRQASGLIDALGYLPTRRADAVVDGDDARSDPVGDGDADADIHSVYDPARQPTAGRTGAVDRPAPEGPIVDPFEAVERLPEDHPYRVVGAGALREGLSLFDDAVGDAYRGGHTDANALVPTFGGRVKPTARYPRSAAAGLASDERPMVVVGFRSLTGYDARAVADRLRASGVPFTVAGVEVEFTTAFRDDAAITRVARSLDRNEPIDGTPAREALAAAVGSALDDTPVDSDGDGVRVGLPAVVGDDAAPEVRSELADRLGCDVFEIPPGPPSLPGLRLADRLYAALDDAGVRYETGVPVVGHALDGDTDRVAAALVDRHGREVPYTADAFVLAAGGLVGKGIESDRGGIREPVFDCHVPHPEDRYEWYVDDAFGDQPYARFGVRPDDRLRPVGPDGQRQFANVHVAGATLGGADVAREKSASGVSLATGLVAGREAAREANQ